MSGVRVNERGTMRHSCLVNPNGEACLAWRDEYDELMADVEAKSEVDGSVNA